MLLNNIRFSHNPTLLYAAISKSSPSIPSPALNEVKKALRDPQSCCLPQGSAGGLRAQAERGDLHVQAQDPRRSGPCTPGTFLLPWPQDPQQGLPS